MLGRRLESEVGPALGRALGGARGPALGRALGASRGPELGRTVGRTLGEALGCPLGIVLGGRLGPKLGPKLERVFGVPLGDALGAVLGGSVGFALGEWLGGKVTSMESREPISKLWMEPSLISPFPTYSSESASKNFCKFSSDRTLSPVCCLSFLFLPSPLLKLRRNMFAGTEDSPSSNKGSPSSQAGPHSTVPIQSVLMKLLELM